MPHLGGDTVESGRAPSGSGSNGECDDAISIRFSLNAAWLALRAIAAMDAPDQQNPALRALGRLRASVEHAAVDEVLESGLDEFLGTVEQLGWQVTDHVKDIYLRLLGASDRLMSVTRAAMIMAAQQQRQQ